VLSGPTQPFPGDAADPEAGTGAPAAAGEQPLDLELDPARLAVASRAEPWRVRHLMYLVAGAAAFFWLAILVASSIVLVWLLIVGGLVFLFSSVMSACVIVARRRSTRQDALLWVMAIAAEKEMPLAPAVVAFADQYRGSSYRRIMDLAAQLNWGTSVPESLERARKVVSRDATLLAWVGEAAGMLPKSLRIAAATRSSSVPIWTVIAARIAYILMLLISLQTIMGFIMYFIMPKFEAIFKDFGQSLPMITIFTIDMSHYIVRYGFLTMFIPLIEVGLLVALPFSFLGWGNFSVPMFDRIMGRRHTALVMRSLSLVVEGNKPIGVGLATLAAHYPAFWIRRRLQSAASDVRHGVDWISALWRHRLIKAADAEVCASAAKVGNLAWALSELADSAERRLQARFQAGVMTAFPFVVILLGAVIFLMAVAYFMPLVQLIQRLADL
jgi:protein transport protein HofC